MDWARTWSGGLYDIYRHVWFSFFVYKTGLIARLAGFCDLIKQCMTNELIAAHTTWRFQCAREQGGINSNQRQMLAGIHLEANGPFECWAMREAVAFHWGLIKVCTYGNIIFESLGFRAFKNALDTIITTVRLDGWTNAVCCAVLDSSLACCCYTPRM